MTEKKCVLPILAEDHPLTKLFPLSISNIWLIMVLSLTHNQLNGPEVD